MARTDLATLRTEIAERAGRRCEYCHLPEDASWAFHEVDHVIARKHGGKTDLDNLAYACLDCNHHKGTDLTSLDPQTSKITQLFNPRTQKWDDHFQLNEDGIITPLTAEGRTTAALLKFNDLLRVQIRADLITTGKLSLTPGQS